MSLEPANESQALTARSLIAAVNRPGACEHSQDVMKPPYEPPITPTLDASHSGRSQRRIEQREHVVDVDGAERADDRAAVLLPVAGRTPRIAHHHRVPGAGVHLRLVEQRRCVGGVRAAVHEQQHRVRPGTGGRDQPAVHRIAVRCGRRQLDRRPDADRGQRHGRNRTAAARRCPIRPARG